MLRNRVSKRQQTAVVVVSFVNSMRRQKSTLSLASELNDKVHTTDMIPGHPAYGASPKVLPVKGAPNRKETKCISNSSSSRCFMSYTSQQGEGVAASRPLGTAFPMPHRLRSTQ